MANNEYHSPYTGEDLDQILTEWKNGSLGGSGGGSGGAGTVLYNNQNGSLSIGDSDINGSITQGLYAMYTYVNSNDVAATVSQHNKDIIARIATKPGDFKMLYIADKNIDTAGSGHSDIDAQNMVVYASHALFTGGKFSASFDMWSATGNWAQADTPMRITLLVKL